MYRLQQAKVQLRKQIRSEIARQTIPPSAASTPSFRRIEIPIEPIDPLKWLVQQNHTEKTYWFDREEKFEMAGIGVTYVIAGETGFSYKEVFSRLAEALLHSPPRQRYFGGMVFDPAQPVEQEWSSFGWYRFILPRWEIVRREEETFLCANYPAGVMDDQIKIMEAELEHLIYEEREESLSLPEICSREDYPPLQEWEHSLRKALNRISGGELQKVVLARKTVYSFQEQINPLSVLLPLKAEQPRTFRFAFRTADGATFLGATPERLYRRTGHRIESEALAGTRPRGSDAASDLRLEEELQGSGKDLEEHRWVSRIVEGNLRSACTSLEIPTKESVLKLPEVQHLYTLFRGQLKEEIGDAELLALLHPTPAVGGHPRRDALQTISRLEPFSRGWYAAPVGWVSRDAAEFAVGIRSALFTGNRAAVYAGAGIVSGSDPQQEWLEIENKMKHFSKLLGEQ